MQIQKMDDQQIILRQDFDNIIAKIGSFDKICLNENCSSFIKEDELQVAGLRTYIEDGWIIQEPIK